MKCALNCVHGCLGKCSHVYSSNGIEPSRTCYVDCTKKCLPDCAYHATDADLAALTARAGQSVEAEGVVPHTGMATESSELRAAALPRGGAR